MTPNYRCNMLDEGGDTLFEVDIAAGRREGTIETYRIIPGRRAYRVEAIAPDGKTRLLQTWPTEEAAVSYLKALRERVEIANDMQIGALDRRG
jgi:hypothetical protein